MASQGQRSGDAAGRRIWRRRARHLEHAGRVASLLRVLLRRAGSRAAADLAAIERSIAVDEAIAIQRSSGTIEPRTRFARTDSSGNPVREKRPLNWLFLDEGGTAQPVRGPEDGAWFALAGVAMTLEQAQSYERAADELKMEFFNHTEITLHEPLMRTHRQDFSFGGDTHRQRLFCEAVDRLVSDASFVAFAVGLRKWELSAETALPDSYLPAGAYEIAMHLLLERYVDYLHYDDEDWRGRLTLEAQGSREDAEHQQAYVELLLNGTQWVPDSAFRNYLETGVRFVGKRGSHATELSDMLARDVFEWIRSGCKQEPRRWRIFEEKFYSRGDLRRGKFGLKVFPADGIEDWVEAQRERSRTRLRRP